MDVKYIGGDEPWTLPFGDHFNSSHGSFQTSTCSVRVPGSMAPSELETIARRHGFEPLYSVNEKRTEPKFPFANDQLQWMNSGTMFADKRIEPSITGAHETDFADSHGHTFCYLCSINAHHHERTQPREQALRRRLIPYNNPKALKGRPTTKDRPGSGSTGNSTSYRFIVRTRKEEGSGTRAQVFLYMYGTECEWTSINLRARTGPAVDGFPTGSARTFCLKGPDIGQLHHLSVNLVGARSSREWFLKEIEITNLNTSITWLCEFNCWLPKSDGKDHHLVRPTVDPHEQLHPSDLSVYTGGKHFAGTDSTIHVMLKGSRSQTRRIALTTAKANLFEQNQLDTFAIVGWNLGDLLELTVDTDRAHMASDWDLREMVVRKIQPADDYPESPVYFPFNKWLGKKESTATAKREKYAVTDARLRGPTCYHISIKTGKAAGAGTDANVFIMIFGASGRTCVHHLDNRSKNDFEKNTTSQFTIMDIDVGVITEIKIWHDNSKPGAGWFLDTVLIRKKHSTCRLITTAFVDRSVQVSRLLYNQAVEHVKKDNRARSSSPKDRDRHSTDRSASRTSNQQKKVTWDEDSIGASNDRFSRESLYSKSKHAATDQKHSKDLASALLDAGSYEHHAHWISSHSYNSNQWTIRSIEEDKSFSLSESTRTQLLSDRAATGSKVKVATHDRDDDVYEFQANRWLASDEGDRKLEVYLKPKDSHLSTQTIQESKSRRATTAESTADLRRKPLSSSSSTKVSTDDHHHASHGSPRSLTPADRASPDPHRKPAAEPTGALKRLGDSFMGKFDRSMSPDHHHHHPGASRSSVERTASPASKPSGHTSPHTRSPIASIIDAHPANSSDSRSKASRDPPSRSTTISGSQRELLAKVPDQPARSTRPPAKSMIDPHSSDWHGQRTRSPRETLERTTPVDSREELLAQLTGQRSHTPRSTTMSLTDTRSPDAYHQHSRSPRLHPETSSPSSRKPLDPKSGLHALAAASPAASARSQIYSSAYGTMPTDHH